MVEQNTGIYRRTNVIREIITLGKIVYSEKEFKKFKDTPRRSLGGKTPREAIIQGKAQEVFGLITSMYEGSDIV